MPREKSRKVRTELIRGQEAARLLGVTRPTVLSMIARGELESETVAGLVLVKRADVERIAAERQAAESDSAAA